jgi:3-oxoacyl-[acyl-carrier protein] reductase
MNILLKNKTAIITGASSGIGKASAIAFAKEGARVVITSRREKELQEVCNEINAFGICEYIVADGNDLTSVEKIFSFAIKKFKKVDILVCNAGMALRQPTLEMTPEQWEQVIRVNLTYPMFLSQIAIQEFLKHGGGKIVMVSSTAGKNINLGASPSYGASKAGLLYLVRHIAAEFGEKGIYANAVCPGPVDTDITKTWTTEYRQNVLSSLPLGRMGTSEDIANCILFLASNLSDYVNGEALLANGGKYMQ